jgi:hypothetical protein
VTGSEADELYGAPPEEFIARRDARAKELRKAGDRAAADAVKKLRKPSVAAAAVNRLARTAADDVSALLAAGEALRQAQLGGGDRDAIRAAARDEREAVETLVAQAGRLSPAVAEEVRSTLHAAASDDEARDSIRRGVLTDARAAVGLGGFGFPSAPSDIPSASPRSSRKSTSKKKSSGGAVARERERERAAAAERKAEAERKKAAKERVNAARAALREAEKAATAAERERGAAEKALAKAERAAEKAQAEVERRRNDLEEAEGA